ncbi:MAG: MoaD/ThiS family protein [Anaerolineaceae bacterium]|nr:MoaD/ThiS family protein [Anaerolineaceae bacterium]
MKVHIPTQLRSYTRVSVVEAQGQTLAEVLYDLDRQFPGIRFRMINEQDEIREHIRIFVNRETVFDLERPMGSEDEVRIIGALSGG